MSTFIGTLTSCGLLTSLLIALAVPPCARAQAFNSATDKITVTFTRGPKDTQTTITGMLSGDTATLSPVQGVYIEVVNVSGNAGLDGKYSSSTYSFTATNLKPLAEGQFVHVHVCGAHADHLHGIHDKGLKETH